MDKRALIVAVLLATAACKKTPQAQTAAAPVEPPAQNAATQYAAGLQHDVQKAQDVAQKANAAVQKNDNAMNEATSQ